MNDLTIVDRINFKEKILLPFQLLWRIIFLSMIADRFRTLFLLSELPSREVGNSNVASKYLIFCYSTELVCIFLSVLWLSKAKVLTSIRRYSSTRSSGGILSHLNLKDYYKILFLSSLICCLKLLIFILLTYFMMNRYGDDVKDTLFLVKIFDNILIYLCIFLLFSMTSFFRNIFIISNNNKPDATIKIVENTTEKYTCILQSAKLIKTAFVTAYALIWRIMLIAMIGNRLPSFFPAFGNNESFSQSTHALDSPNGIEIFLHILSDAFYVLLFLSFYLLYFGFYILVLVKLEDLPFQKFKLSFDSSTKGKIVIGICFFLLAWIISIPIVFGVLSILSHNSKLSSDLAFFLVPNIETFPFIVNFFVYTATFYLFAKLEWIKFEEIKINDVT